MPRSWRNTACCKTSVATGAATRETSVASADSDTKKHQPPNELQPYMVPIPFRSTATGNTAVAVKASAGKIYGFNIINPHSSSIYVKFYDIAAGSVNPASDKPTYTIMVSASGEDILRGLDVPFNFETAISMRAVTGVADTDTTAPASLPIIELDIY
jgi:hypothetical protein